MRFLLASFLLFLVTGCETVNVPAYAKFKDDQKTLLQGSLTNNILTLSNVEGLYCSGNYAEYNFAPTVQIPLNCNDGRNGSVLITFNETRSSFLDKQPKKITGYGQGALSDNTKFEVFIGRVSGMMKAPSFVK